MSGNQNNLTVSTQVPGIRMYIEDPQVVIKRKIRRTIWIVIVSIVLLVAGVLILSVTIKKKTESIVLQQKNLAVLLQKQNMALNLGQNWSTIEPYKDMISSALPQASNLLSYQAALENAANASGVQISVNFNSEGASAQKNNSSKKVTYQAVDHEISVTGTANNILVFMSKLNSIPYYVNLDKFKITSGKDNNYLASLKMQIFTEPAK